MYKFCKKCHEPKPITSYYKAKQVGNKTYYRSTCIECYTKELNVKRNSDNKYKEYQQKWRKENVEHIRRKRIVRLYGEDALKLFESKDECDICGSTERLNIDHNHLTGEVRGILCSGCNTGIGLLGDSPSNLIKAVRYLSQKGNYSTKHED